MILLLNALSAFTHIGMDSFPESSFTRRINFSQFHFQSPNHHESSEMECLEETTTYDTERLNSEHMQCKHQILYHYISCLALNEFCPAELLANNKNVSNSQAKG